MTVTLSLVQLSEDLSHKVAITSAMSCVWLGPGNLTGERVKKDRQRDRNAGIGWSTVRSDGMAPTVGQPRPLPSLLRTAEGKG